MTSVLFSLPIPAAHGSPVRSALMTGNTSFVPASCRSTYKAVPSRNCRSWSRTEPQVHFQVQCDGRKENARPIDVEKEAAKRVMAYINYISVRLTLDQLQETMWGYREFHNFCATHSLKDSRSFFAALLKENQEMGVRVMTLSDAIATDLRYKALPDLVMNELQDLKLHAYRQVLQESFDVVKEPGPETTKYIDEFRSKDE
mmetsp:Transcript_12156/g.21097  ORF Transcript_12156/g.21097 Transcript_12156/m.21097 type:complete len:201 (-) Transcript_12156:163-765(-)|eukprot:CAMPEP_0196666420 /NCGR_PEP_ID=MMETSP1086-20130531/64503_1 /TAXON_ID=77921 /ORGANISM="Cyanoptyche  gloeocystis , Strain SAG4.97" /LENGTH=200 /DNA_ID=CAMNT_0042003609 /DNA_START=77 /DNA_END=679 /DNA_ORIENTATION=-